MKSSTVFEFKSYRKYLINWVEQNPNAGRGIKSKLAKAAQCQISYLSRVLMGKADLSLDQADLLSLFIGHGEAEAEYFILLVQFERASRATLKARFKRRMDAISAQQMAVGERLAISETLNVQSQTLYHKHWYHGAIHILVSCSEFQTKLALAERLALSLAVVSKALEFLVSTGLVKVGKHGQYSIGQTRLHLHSEAASITQHHTNWRLQAVRSLDQPCANDLHYSVVVGLAREDAEKLKSLLLTQLTEFMKVAHSSAQEDAFSFNLDFFKV